MCIFIATKLYIIAQYMDTTDGIQYTLTNTNTHAYSEDSPQVVRGHLLGMYIMSCTTSLQSDSAIVHHYDDVNDPVESLRDDVVVDTRGLFRYTKAVHEAYKCNRREY